MSARQDRAGSLIEGAARRAKAYAPSQVDSLAYECGLLRSAVRTLAAELEALHEVKRNADFSYFYVQHPVLGFVTVGVDYSAGEPYHADLGPEIHEDATVYEVWIAGKEISLLLDASVLDDLALQVLNQIQKQRRDDDLAYAERRAA